MKKKYLKVITLLACVLVAAVAITGCSTKGDDKTNAPKKKIVVGTASGYFPFEMVDKNGQLVGFDVEVAKALAKEMNVELEFQNYAFSGLIPALQAKKVDIVIAGMTITDKRKEAVDFSEPYFTSGQAMLVNKNYPDVKTWQDLDKEGNVIAVSMGTTADQTATKMFKKATVKKFEGSTYAGLELISGKAVAVIHEVPWVAIYHKQHPENTYPVLEPFTTENLGIAVAKGDNQTLEAINKFLKKYKDSEEYKKTYQYWFVDMPWWDSVPPKK